MKKLLSPANLGFYLLMLLAFFIVGLYVASLVGAGKNQGLAGGAIVFGYGIAFAGVAFVVSLVIGYFLDTKFIVRINWFLLAALLVGCGYTIYQFQTRANLQQQKNRPYPEKPKSPTVTPEPAAVPSSLRIGGKNRFQANYPHPASLGMGMYAPNFFENAVLYFYGNINLEKSLQEHTPTDTPEASPLLRSG